MTIEFPKEKKVGRYGDMTQPGDSVLTLLMQDDGDIVVEVITVDGSDFMRATVEFCEPGSGGGQSTATRIALINLMCAIEKDNLERPRAKPQGGL